MLEKPDNQEGIVIVTDNQTSGKGQRGNVWHSEPGLNLTFSIILKPNTLQIKHQFNLNMMASLAVSDMLKELLPTEEVKVKWPNDVYVNEKKISGILIENTLKPPFLEYAVVGIGLNVNQERFGSDKATSMKRISRQDHSLPELFELLIFSLEKRYMQLKSREYPLLKTDYMTHLIGFRHSRRFRSEYEFEGVIEDVSEEGKLLINIKGQRKAFDLKEITFL